MLSRVFSGVSAQNVAVLVGAGSLIYFTAFDKEHKELKAEMKQKEQESKLKQPKN